MKAIKEIKKEIKYNTKIDFLKTLTDTIFQGKNTRNTINRIKNLYGLDENRGVPEKELYLYSAIKADKYDQFIKRINSMTSDIIKLNNEINDVGDKSVGNNYIFELTNKKYLYQDMAVFIKNIADGLSRTQRKIYEDLKCSAHAKYNLNIFLSQVKELSTKLKPARENIFTELANFEKSVDNLIEMSEFSEQDYIKEYQIKDGADKLALGLISKKDTHDLINLMGYSNKYNIPDGLSQLSLDSKASNVQYDILAPALHLS